MSLGLWTVILAHISFMIPFVTLVVQARLQGLDKSYEEAAMDLGAERMDYISARHIPNDSAWRACRRIIGIHAFHRRLYHHVLHEWSRLRNIAYLCFWTSAPRHHSSIECPFHGLDSHCVVCGFPYPAIGKPSKINGSFVPNLNRNVCRKFSKGEELI